MYYSRLLLWNVLCFQTIIFSNNDVFKRMFKKMFSNKCFKQMLKKRFSINVIKGFQTNVFKQLFLQYIIQQSIASEHFIVGEQQCFMPDWH